MTLKARTLRRLMEEAAAAKIELYEGAPLESLRQLPAWDPALSPVAEQQALESLRALRSLQSEQVPPTRATVVATSSHLGGIPRIDGALSRIFERCETNLLAMSLTWSESMAQRIYGVAAKGRAITLVGNADDPGFRSMLALWTQPHNRPTALVACGVAMMHVKAVVSDVREGYLGSGNLTDGGTRNNMELGIRFEGRLAGEIWEFVNLQRRGGRLVEYRG